MDPVSLVVTAIVSGAATALSDSAGDAVRAAYGRLKGLIGRRLAGDDAGRTALENVEGEDGDAWKAPLESRLRKHMSEDDEELVLAAQELLAQVDPEGAHSGKYVVNVTDSKGVQIGDHAQATMIFRDD
ncbi:MAG TPA: hypothetical protein VNO82_20795 [Solirubrobacteraceae bacterium]|nr:hypothetical protein [Solirubrobacteraceae bacterium]